MNKKVWSISTTVRNPERLKDFLATLSEIDGRAWDGLAQMEFQARLIKNRVYGFSNSQFYNGLDKNLIKLIDNPNNEISLDKAMEIFEAKNYEDPAMRGRTSFKPLEKIGLATIENKFIKITDLGRDFLLDKLDLGELYLKSFLKWQYPNPVDKEFADAKIYNIKPFIATLHLINEVNQICKNKGLKAKGISKLEFTIFAQSLLDFTCLKTQAQNLIDFRTELGKIKDYKKEQEFIDNYINNFFADFQNATFKNLKDYADNTIRYFRLTRLIYIRGGGYYIDLEPRRSVEIRNLLTSFNATADDFTKDEYKKYICDKNLPILPWQDKQNEILDNLKCEIKELEKSLNLKETFVIQSDELESQITELRAYRGELLNLILKARFENLDNIDKVIEALKNINKLDIKPSIALEKYINLALNIINDAIKIKPNSLFGDDNEIIFTAPANRPDIECFYDGFNSICEVTILSGRNQWYNEGQPVMRHLREFENVSAKEDNYCIFIAPKIHRDTLNTFWIANKYEYEGKKQKIIPLNIAQIIEILTAVKTAKADKKMISHIKFKNLLDFIIKDVEISQNCDEWMAKIPVKILSYKESLI